MATSTYLLFALGCLGGLDILLFHTISHGIRTNKESANELFTHALRGPTYGALFVLVPNFSMHGAWAWFLSALFVIDLLISIFDFAMEGESRRKLGGLPAGEYLLHILLAMLFGALVMSTVPVLKEWAPAATSLDYSPAQVRILARALLGGMALLALYSGVLDFIAMLRLKRQLKNYESGPC